MAELRKCDRCGIVSSTIAEAKDWTNFKKLTANSRVRTLRGLRKAWSTFELCTECAKAFKVFMESK